MVATIGGFIIEPQGQSLVVTITTPSGSTPTVYTSAAGSATHSLPVTISSETQFWFAKPITVSVSAKLNNVEVADGQGNALAISVQPGMMTVLSPGVQQGASESGTFAPYFRNPVSTAYFWRGDGVWAVPSGTGGGDVASDGIWDVKGDVVAATGADAAARVPVGSDGQALIADAASTAGVKWAAPAPATHSHAESDVTSLTSDLAAKAASTHTHVESDTTSLVTDLAAKIPKSTVTTKGDLIAATASATVARVGVGSDGQALVADAASTPGVKWAAPAPAAHVHTESDTTSLTTDLAAKVPLSTVTAKGDLLAASGNGAVSRLPVGSNNQVLTADSAQATGVKWATPSAGAAGQSGSGSPIGSVTPNAAGATYTDTVTGLVYAAIGTTTASWVLVSTTLYPATLSLDLSGSRDITSTSGSNQFTSASANWAIGQVLVVRGAGAAGAAYVGVITGVSGTTATANGGNAGASLSNATGFWGTDDTANLQAALKAAPVGTTVTLGPVFRCLIRQRNDASCGTTNAGHTVTDASVIAGDVGKMVTGPGIPANTFVGTVSAGVSFTLVDSAGSFVNATATGTVTICIGGLWVPPGVQLLPMKGRNWDPQNNRSTTTANPAITAYMPTFGIVQAAGVRQLGSDFANPMIGLTENSSLGDCCLYSLNQKDPTVSTPSAFGPIVSMIARSATYGYFGDVSGCSIGNILMPNAYIGVAINGLRHNIGIVSGSGFFRLVTIDHNFDFTFIQAIRCWVYYRYVEGQVWGPTAGTFDAYVINNLWVLEMNRADGLDVGSVQNFMSVGAVLADDSADTGQAAGGFSCGTAHINSVTADGVVYGLYAAATLVNNQALGLVVDRLITGSADGVISPVPQYAVFTAAGGTLAPYIKVASINMYQAGMAWAGGVSHANAGTVIVPGTNPG